MTTLVALVPLLVSLACGCEPEPNVAREEMKGVIAFVGVAGDDPIWRVLEATALRQQDTVGHLSIRVATPENPTANAQVRLLRRLYSPRMRGLCIQPADGRAMQEILEELRSKGVAVVTMLETVPSHMDFMHAGVDDMAIGRAMADAIHDAVGSEGTIAIIHDEQRDVHYTDRYLGFQERLRNTPGIHVLRELDCKNNEFVARRQLRDFMERFPRLNGWVSIDDWPLRLIDPEERLLPASCTMVTYNPLPQYWPLIRNGTCHAIIGARYDLVAERAIHMCAAALYGELPSTGSYAAPPVTVTARNLTVFKLDWFKWREIPEGAAEGQGS
jgi:ribose transport system substrate-binding protein